MFVAFVVAVGVAQALGIPAVMGVGDMPVGRLDLNPFATILIWHAVVMVIRGEANVAVVSHPYLQVSTTFIALRRQRLPAPTGWRSEDASAPLALRGDTRRSGATDQRS